MKTLEITYLKSSSRIPDWMKLFLSDLRFYFSETENEIETLNQISEYLDKFEYKRRNAMCSGAFIKRHLEDNRLYICNSNSDTALSIITYK